MINKITSLSATVVGRLLIAFALTTIPLVALAFYLTVDARRQEDKSALAEERVTTQLVAEDVSLGFQLTRKMVAGLIHEKSDAEICEALRGNLEAFPQLANMSLQEVRKGVSEAKPVCTVTGPSILPRRNFPADEVRIMSALSHPGEVAVGSVRLSQSRAREVIPIFGLVGDRPDGTRRIVMASLDLQWLNQRVNRIQVPDQAALLVVDRNGVIAARNPASQKWPVGKPAPRFERTLPGRGDFAGEVVSMDDGISRYYTVRRIDSADGLIVLMKRRSSVIFAASRRRLFVNLISIVVIFAAIFAIVWRSAGRRVVTPLRKLGQAANRLAAGESTVRTGMDYRGEIGALAGSFDLMAEAVEREGNRNRLLIESLRESERRFRELLETVHLAVVIVDKGGDTVFCNECLLGLTSWTREEVLGHTFLNLIAAEDRGPAGEQLRDLRERAQIPQTSESRIATKSGLKRQMKWNNTILRDAAGDPTGFCGLGVDVTEHRALIDQRRQSERLETVGRLAAGVAHDFNNILTVINGYSDLALRRVRDDNPLHTPLMQIRDAGEQAAALTRQLLTFSRKQVVNAAPLDLNRAIAESTVMLEQILGGRIRLVTSLGRATGCILADKAQLQQVLLNLITNSMRATPDGGTVRIETSVAAHPQGMPGEWPVLTVSDTGSGMEPETLSHVFEPFFTTSTDGKGTGLGLSIVYGIVQQSNGYLSVESEPGLGTTFRIWWPRVDSAEEAGDAAQSQKSFAGSETILVADDRDEVRDILVAMLEKCGYKVIAASGGHQALRLAAEAHGRIDLLLTDVAMPEMNGLELARLLTLRDPKLKVVLMSGYAADVVKGKVLSDSGFDFIQKPMTEAVLASKIRQVLDSRPVLLQV